MNSQSRPSVVDVVELNGTPASAEVVDEPAFPLRVLPSPGLHLGCQGVPLHELSVTSTDLACLFAITLQSSENLCDMTRLVVLYLENIRNYYCTMIL